jgi:sulfate adenylyltransferase
LASPGFTIWITGLPSSGKSTLARTLRDTLGARGVKAELLDSDDLRKTLSRDLGFSRHDRDSNVARLSGLAQTHTRAGAVAIVAAVSPYRDARDEARRAHGSRFVEVFLDAPMEVLRARDSQGLYAKADRGEIANLTGVSDPYEPPLSPELTLSTDRQSPDECATAIIEWLDARGWLSRPAP